jgi:hypothetical protein
MAAADNHAGESSATRIWPFVLSPEVSAAVARVSFMAPKVLLSGSDAMLRARPFGYTFELIQEAHLLFPASSDAAARSPNALDCASLPLVVRAAGPFSHTKRPGLVAGNNYEPTTCEFWMQITQLREGALSFPTGLMVLSRLIEVVLAQRVARD